MCINVLCMYCVWYFLLLHYHYILQYVTEAYEAAAIVFDMWDCGNDTNSLFKEQETFLLFSFSPIFPNRIHLEQLIKQQWANVMHETDSMHNMYVVVHFVPYSNIHRSNTFWLCNHKKNVKIGSNCVEYNQRKFQEYKFCSSLIQRKLHCKSFVTNKFYPTT